VSETVPGYQSTLWYALLAPAKTPPAIIKRVHDETLKSLAAPQMREQMLALGATPVGNFAAGTADFYQQGNPDVDPSGEAGEHPA